MGKRVRKRKTNTGAESLWQRRYFRLQGEIQNLYETRVQFKRFEKREKIPNECFSASQEFFISNDLYVVDNEAYALKHWGEGRYFRVVIASSPQDSAKGDK